MKLCELPTPALILDRPRLMRNIDRMSERMLAAGVALRPHLKTAKSIHVARLSTAGHSGAITVSTLAEAEYFAQHGVRAMTLGVCIVPDKLPRVRALQGSGVALRLITDSVQIARDLARSPAEHALDVLVEIDSGEHRTGIAPDSDALIEIATLLHRGPATMLAGVFTHGGHAYSCEGADALREVAEQERLAVTTAARRLTEAGLPCPCVSAGSTPTAIHAQRFEGLSEMRPGVYMFNDLAQLGLGSCADQDLALSVLATVISHRPEHDRLLVDAGALALSKDTSANASLTNTGYGWVTDVETCERIDALHVTATDQEHGFVSGGKIPWKRVPLGARVRILPNHACMTAAAYDRYWVVEGDDVVDQWPRMNGW